MNSITSKNGGSPLKSVTKWVVRNSVIILRALYLIPAMILLLRVLNNSKNELEDFISFSLLLLLGGLCVTLVHPFLESFQEIYGKELSEEEQQKSIKSYSIKRVSPFYDFVIGGTCLILGILLAIF